MPKTLALWHADHVNFAKLLDLLEAQLELFHESESPEYELMLDIMYYMTHYSDVLHHPKEDLVFAKIKQRRSSVGSRVDDLTKQHARLKIFGERLVHDLDGIVNGSITARDRVESDARTYLSSLRSHMRFEEAEILPLAAELLDDDDWSAVESAIQHFEDPLFGSSVEARYALLFKQIASHARPGDAATA